MAVGERDEYMPHAHGYRLPLHAIDILGLGLGLTELLQLWLNDGLGDDGLGDGLGESSMMLRSGASRCRICSIWHRSSATSVSATFALFAKRHSLKLVSHSRHVTVLPSASSRQQCVNGFRLPAVRIAENSTSIVIEIAHAFKTSR